MARRRFARIILRDGPLAAGPGRIGWVTASVVPCGQLRFTLTTAAEGDPGKVAVHEYQMNPRVDGEERSARWVRFVELRPVMPAIATRSGIPEWRNAM